MNSCDLNRAKILVAGDMMLDLYIFGTVDRISPEAPIPVMLKDRERSRYVLGGAANVAVNMVAAGVPDVTVLSVVGRDDNGKSIRRELGSAGIQTDYIVEEDARVTTTKLRYIGQNNQQLLRVDNEDTFAVSNETVLKKLKILENTIDEYRLFVLSDYQKGFLTLEITQYLISLANNHHIPVLVDVKDSNLAKYEDAFLLKPNRKELGILTGMSVNSTEDVIEAACFLCKAAKCEYVLTTLGADGMMLVNKKGLIRQGTSVAREVFDVTGAGDTFIAYFASGLMRGMELFEAMDMAGCAAGIQVSKLGTSIVCYEEVRKAMGELVSQHQNKRLNVYVPDGLKMLELQRCFGKTIVFTNGCFDILHAGHVTYLEQAAKLGDILVVGVNSDASTRRLKGKERPINILEDRIIVLESLECVDYIVPFEEDTPLKLIEKISPNVLVKGGDYQETDIVGADFVRAKGGTVKTIPLLKGRGTTNMINKILNGGC